MKYSAKATPVPTKPGCWNYNLIEVFDENGEKCGDYTRNYHAFYKTFAHFERDGKDYALISKDYTATMLIALPSMEEVWTQSRDSFGFCPIEFWAPPELQGKWAFMSGCIWGDDNSKKVRLIDLRDLKDVKITERFGYSEISWTATLEERIELCVEEDFAETSSFSVDILSSREYYIEGNKEEEERLSRCSSV